MSLEDVGVILISQNAAQFQAAMKSADASVSKLDKSLDDLNGTSKRAATAADPLKKSLEDLGKKVVAAFAVDKIMDFARAAITAASDMNETISKSSVVFGEAAGAVEAMGDTAATSMGISKQAAIAAAATYGNLFTSMGMGKQASAEMSIGLVRLASDLSSFNNIPVDQVLEKLRSGLVGESEPLKSLGININETTIKNEAMRLGLLATGQVLDANTKAQAVYSLMLQQTTNAQGDFARTADGLANQQRILEARTQDLTASIGKGLLPAWLEVVRIGNQVLGTVDQLIIMQSGYTDLLIDHNNVMKKQAKNYQEYRTEMVRAAQAAGWNVDAEGRLFKIVRDAFGARTEYNDSIRITTASEWSAKKATDALAPAVAKLIEHYVSLTSNGYLTAEAASRQNDAYSQLAKIMGGEAVQAAKALAAEQDSLKTRMSEVALFMAGSVGKENEKYISDLQTARDALKDTQVKMQELLQIKGPWTPEQQAAYSSLLSAQDTEKAKIAEIEAAHDKAMKTILANMLLTQLSYDGLTSEEAAFYTKTISDWGLIDQATVTAWGEVQKMVDKLHGATTAADEFTTAMGKPVTKNITLKYTKIGDNPNEPTSTGATEPGWGSGGGNGGAQIMVNQMVSAAMVPGAGVAAPSYSYAYHNNYNLSVMTNNSPAAVQQSFAVMKLLAG